VAAGAIVRQLRRLQLSNTPHTLHDEFPDDLDKIHALKMSNREFAQVLEKYDEINDQIHRAETRIEPISEQAEEILRKQRLVLKDKIAAALSAT
jgi:uncharacterized protein YdcH (DUF465 family)